MRNKSLPSCRQGLGAAENPPPSLRFGDRALSLLLGTQVGKEQKSQWSEAMRTSLKELLVKPTTEGQQKRQK